MSIKIHLDCDSMLWRSIDWKRASVHLTQLKSRIYKALNAKLYTKAAFLQNKLIYSLSTRHLALRLIKDSAPDAQLDILSNPKTLYFASQCNLADLRKELSSLCSERKELVSNLIYVLLLFALEPICNSCTSKKNFFLLYASLIIH